MNDMRLDLQQVPAQAELLLAAELGEDAPGRPIFTRREPDGDGEPTARIKVGGVLTRRLSSAEVTETPSGAAYGKPLRGRPERAPCVAVGSAVLARTAAADAHSAGALADEELLAILVGANGGPGRGPSVVRVRVRALRPV